MDESCDFSCENSVSNGFGHGVRQADQILIPRLMQHFTHSRQARSESKSEFVQKHNGFSKTYAIPAGMYASQFWATPYLQQGKDIDSPLQKWLLAVLKRLLGIRDTMVCVMRECGLESLRFDWFRAAIRL
jgi:hypothetical protein